MDKDLREYMIEPSRMDERSPNLRKELFRLYDNKDAYDNIEYYYTDVFNLTHDYILRRYSRGFMTSIDYRNIGDCVKFLTAEYINWAIMNGSNTREYVSGVNLWFPKFVSKYYQMIRYDTPDEDIYNDTDVHYSLSEMSGLVRTDSTHDYNNIVEVNSFIPMDELPDYVLNKYCDLPIDTPEYKCVSISLYMSIVECHPRMYCLDNSWYGYVHYLYNSYIVEMKYNNYKRMMKIHVERDERVILDDYDGIVPVT